MVSVLRTLQAEWNSMVPRAQELGIRRVRALNAPLETIEYRRNKVDWLRDEIARLSGATAMTPAVESNIDQFTFGVELEILMPHGMSHNALARHITAAGVECHSEGYNHTTGGHWKVVTDGSLGDYTRGAEVVSPVLRSDAGFTQVKKVCDALTAQGCKVNKKCGLHVHVGARDWELNTFKNLIRLYKSSEIAIDSFMAPSRRASNNSYAQALMVREAALTSATNMDEVARAIGQMGGARYVRNSGRYYKINLQSYWQHGTVEFRHHQGTVEADKVLNWTKLCLRMAAAAVEGTHYANSLQTLFEAVKAPQAEAQFFTQRAAAFANQLARNVARAERQAAERRAAWTRPAAPAPVDENNPFTQTGDDLGRRSTTSGQF